MQDGGGLLWSKPSAERPHTCNTGKLASSHQGFIGEKIIKK